MRMRVVMRMRRRMTMRRRRIRRSRRRRRRSDRRRRRRGRRIRMIARTMQAFIMVPTGSVSQSRKDECMRNASKAIALATTRNQNNLLQ